MILAALFGPTCVEAQDERYYNDQYGFSIIPPEEWTTEEEETLGFVVRFLGPTHAVPGGMYITELDIQVGPATGTLEELISGLKEYYEFLLTNYQLVSETTRTINNLDAYEIVFTFEDYMANIVKMKQVVLLDYGQFYSIVLDTTQDRYDEHLPTFEASVGTFETYEPVEPEPEIRIKSIGIVGEEHYLNVDILVIAAEIENLCDYTLNWVNSGTVYLVTKEGTQYEELRGGEALPAMMMPHVTVRCEFRFDYSAINTEELTLHIVGIYYEYTYETYSVSMNFTTDTHVYDVGELLQLYEDAQANITYLEERRTALEAEVSALENQVTDLRGQKTNLETQVRNLQGQITDLEDTINTQEEAYIRLQNTTNRTIMNLEEELASVQAEITNIENDLSTAQTQITTLDNEMRTLRDQLNQTGSQLQTTKQEKAGLETTKASLETEIDGLNDQIANKTTRIQNLENLEKNMTDQINKLTAKKEELEETVSTMNHTAAKMTQTIQEREDTVRAQNGRITDLETQTAKQNKTITALEDRNEELNETKQILMVVLAGAAIGLLGAVGLYLRK